MKMIGKKRHFTAAALCWMIGMLLLIQTAPALYGQKPKVSLKDSVDHHLDLSDWVLNAHGFIPVPTIITEPAVGSFGGGVFAVFLEPNAPYMDTLKGQVIRKHAKANLYGVGGIYTINGTWAAGAATQGIIRKWHVVYRLIGAYADANLTFYTQVADAEEKSFEFNMRMIPVYGQLVKEFGYSNWSAGVNYMWLKTDLMRTNSEFHEPKEVNSLISRPGIVVEYDKRDNDFTPEKGLRWNTLLNTSAEWLGSDYSYYAVNTALFAWIPVSDKIYSGYRTEYQQMWDDPPFFLLPFIRMRGIPLARYQGDRTLLAETEWRWDVTRRWSAVGFGGVGKAIRQGDSFNESPWRWAGGVGGRYLIARKLKIRGGIDVARGPEEWAYYIVLGSYWAR